MPAFQLYRKSWFSRNLSSRALNVSKVGDETMLSGKLFHNGKILLETDNVARTWNWKPLLTLGKTANCELIMGELVFVQNSSDRPVARLTPIIVCKQA